MTDREFWKARERCVSCHCQDAFTLSGRALCGVCTEKERARKREKFDSDPEFYRARDRGYYAKRKENRICVKCGKPLEPENSRAKCLPCTRKARVYDRARTIKRRTPEKNWPRGDNGICYMCNRRPVLPGKHSCAACYPWLRDNMLAAKAAQDLTAHPWNRGRGMAGAAQNEHLRT